MVLYRVVYSVALTTNIIRLEVADFIYTCFITEDMKTKDPYMSRLLRFYIFTKNNTFLSQGLLKLWVSFNFVIPWSSFLLYPGVAGIAPTQAHPLKHFKLAYFTVYDRNEYKLILESLPWFMLMCQEFAYQLLLHHQGKCQHKQKGK